MQTNVTFVKNPIKGQPNRVRVEIKGTRRTPKGVLGLAKARLPFERSVNLPSHKAAERAYPMGRFVTVV